MTVRWEGEAVCAVRLSVDQRILDRVEALAMLQREALPGLPYGQEDALRQALERGLDQMLAELLVRRQNPHFLVHREGVENRLGPG
ncbi:MAG: hypothetical protein HY823_02785 [Acidobacteria bacterium]|nr:hypothetical protein [Acidobacteriota bacterium]